MENVWSCNQSSNSYSFDYRVCVWGWLGGWGWLNARTRCEGSRWHCWYWNWTASDYKILAVFYYLSPVITSIRNSIIRAIKRLYEKSFSKIKIGKQLRSGLYITKELRQGCSLSPTLFKLHIQNALENWQKKCAKMGLKIQNTTIYSMLFADDNY